MASPIARYGGVPSPVPGKGAPDGDPTGDPGLGLLLDFLATVLNARAGDAWASVAPGRDPGGKGPLVVNVETHDPAELGMVAGTLPTLYGWRTDGQSEQIAADYHLHRSTLVLLWVPPAETDNPLRVRHPFTSVVPKVLDAALHVGRDPAWVAPGDTDPRAQTEGSLIWEVAGFWRLDGPQRWQRYSLDIPKGENVARYPSLRTTIEVEERLVLTPGPPNEGLDATLTQVSEAGPGFTISFEAE